MTIAGANLVGGRWRPIPGDALRSFNPAHPAQVVWSGTPKVADVHGAIAAARAALPAWSGLPLERRAAVLRRYRDLAAARAGDVAGLLCDEVGKVLWECRQEAALLAAKVDITLDPAPEGGLHRVTPFSLGLSPSRDGRCLFRPHGVMAVIGPFNFPAHLPNGHIVPALLAGNTVVFKPSDKSPAVGQLLAELLSSAIDLELGPGGSGAGAGVVNLVHGGADVAAALCADPGVDAIAFTGSWPVGRRILEANLDRPGRIVALELGGSNPAIVMPDADLRQAAIEIVRCAFNTAGQRCTSTRRAIVHESVAGRLIPAIAKAASNLIVGDPRASHPVFMGPLISAPARQAVLDFARTATDAQVIVPPTTIDNDGGHYLSPGLMRVDRFELSASAGSAARDVEIFGPLLRVSTARDFDDALDQANATRFGLAASLFSADSALHDRFLVECRAGCLNINTGTAGASSKLPFGGLGQSGNHRPAGSFALDYCAYPVAAMLERGSVATIAEGMRFEDGWLSGGPSGR
ncbi:MAG: aldehyde dehydrogenase family protein [Phycisphaerales bacterium]